MTGAVWTAPSECPDERSIERLRNVCCGEPQITAVWLTGARFKHHDGRTANDATTFVIELDPPSGEGVQGEQIEIVTKLDAAWRPSGHHSFWFPIVPLGAKQERGLPIYAKL